MGAMSPTHWLIVLVVLVLFTSLLVLVTAALVRKF